MSTVNVTFNYNANVQGLMASLKQAAAQMSTMNAQIERMGGVLGKPLAVANKHFVESINASKNWHASMVDLESQTDRFSKALDKQNLKLGEYRKLVRTSRAGAIGQKGLVSELAKEQVRLENSLVTSMGMDATGRRKAAVITPAGLDMTPKGMTELAVARKEMQIMNKVLADGATSLVNWGKNTQWAGRQMTVGLTVPMGIFANVAKNAFIEVDEQLVRMEKVYGSSLQNIGGSTDEIRSQVEDLGAVLAKTWGVAMKDTAGVAADIAATGKEGKELIDSTRETVRLSVLGETDRQDAMKATLSLQTAFKLNTTELTDSINFLNAVENQTSATLQDMVEAIPKAGPVVKGLGGDIKDLALMMVAMREGGIDAAEGANAIKSGLASLINPTKEAQDQLNAWGIDIVGIVNRNQGELIPTIMEFKDALSSLTDFQQQQAIETIFGKYQFARIGALFSNIGEAGSQTLDVMELMKASSSDLAAVADQEMNKLQSSTSARWKQAVESIKVQIMPLGEIITQFFTKLLNGVEKILELFNALPEGVKTALIGLGAFVALIGPLVMITGVMANFLGYLFKFGSWFKGRKGGMFEMLTKESVAAQRAGQLVTETTFNEKAAFAELGVEMEKHMIVLNNMIARNEALAASQGKVTAAMAATKPPPPAGGGAPPTRPVGPTGPTKPPSTNPAFNIPPGILESREFARSYSEDITKRKLANMGGMTRGEVMLPALALGEQMRVAMMDAMKGIDPKMNLADMPASQKNAIISNVASGFSGAQRDIVEQATRTMLTGEGKYAVPSVSGNKFGRTMRDFLMVQAAQAGKSVSELTGGMQAPTLGHAMSRFEDRPTATGGKAVRWKNMFGFVQDYEENARQQERAFNVGEMQRLGNLPGTASAFAMGLSHIMQDMAGQVKPVITEIGDSWPKLVEKYGVTLPAARDAAAKATDAAAKATAAAADIPKMIQGQVIKPLTAAAQTMTKGMLTSGKGVQREVYYSPDKGFVIPGISKGAAEKMLKSPTHAAPLAALKTEWQDKERARREASAQRQADLRSRRVARQAELDARRVTTTTTATTDAADQLTQAAKKQTVAAQQQEKTSSTMARTFGSMSMRGMAIGGGAAAVGALTGNEALAQAGSVVGTLGMAAWGLEAFSSMVGNVTDKFKGLTRNTAGLAAVFSRLFGGLFKIVGRFGPIAAALTSAYIVFDQMRKSQERKERAETAGGKSPYEAFGMQAIEYSSRRIKSAEDREKTAEDLLAQQEEIAAIRESEVFKQDVKRAEDIGADIPGILEFLRTKATLIQLAMGEEAARTYIDTLSSEIGQVGLGEKALEQAGGGGLLAPIEDRRKRIAELNEELERLEKLQAGTAQEKAVSFTGEEVLMPDMQLVGKYRDQILEVERELKELTKVSKASAGELGTHFGDAFRFIANSAQALRVAVEPLVGVELDPKQFDTWKESIKRTNPELYEAIKNLKTVEEVINFIPRDIGINIGVHVRNAEELMSILDLQNSIATGFDAIAESALAKMDEDIQDVAEEAQKSAEDIKEAADDQIDAIEDVIDAREKANRTADRADEKAKKAQEDIIEGIEEEIEAIEKGIDAHEEEINGIEEKIDAIQKEYDERRKLYDIAKETADFFRDQQQLELDYYEALAKGDYAQAASVRLQQEQAAADFGHEAIMRKIDDQEASAVGVEEAKIAEHEAAIKAEEDRIKVKEAVIEEHQAEIERIDEIMEKRNEELELFKENEQDKIEAIRDRAEAEVEAIEDAAKKKSDAAITTKDKVMEMAEIEMKKIREVAAVGGDVNKAINDSRVVMEAQLVAMGWDSARAKAYTDQIFAGFTDSYKAALTSALGFDPSVLSGIKGTFRTAMLQNMTPLQRAAMQALESFHEGGFVSGEGGNAAGLRRTEKLAVLEHGEVVVNKRAVGKLGRNAVESLNKYHDGGWVGPSTMPAAAAFSGGVMGAAVLKQSASEIGTELGKKVAKMVNDRIVTRTHSSVAGTDIAPAGTSGKANAAYPSPFWGYPPNVSTKRVDAQGKATSVNVRSAPYFQKLLDGLSNAAYPIKALGGIANRNIAGSSRLSQHAFGNAIDINAWENRGDRLGGGGPKYGTFPYGVTRGLVNQNNLAWGADWRSADPMHFEWAGPLREGGKVTRDDMLAKLHEGETVMTAPLTNKLTESVAKFEQAAPLMEAAMDKQTTFNNDNKLYNINVYAKTDANPDEIAREIYRVHRDTNARVGVKY